MKVAFLSDIHANLYALKAVLGDLPGVEKIICCGDLVGYYPEVNEVCALVREVCDGAIRGNHDAYVLGLLEPDPSKVAACGVAWTRQTLTQDHLKWLGMLPPELQFGWESLKVAVRHASPWDETTYIDEDSPERGRILLEKSEFLALGHTHRPMVLQAGEGILLNPGSVGQSRDSDWRPSYAVLDTKSREVEIRRVEYDVKVYQRKLRSLGWNETIIGALCRNENRR